MNHATSDYKAEEIEKQSRNLAFPEAKMSLGRVMHTPPPADTPEETTTVEEKPPPVKSFTTEVTTQIEQLSGMMIGTEQKSQHSEAECSSGKSTPTKEVTSQEEFADKIKLEPKALEYYHAQMCKAAHKTLRFEGSLTKLRKELNQSYPEAKKAEELWWFVEENYSIIKAHREDAIKYFSPETQQLDRYMEKKERMYNEGQENFLAVYTTLSLQRGEERATHSDRQPRDESPKELVKRTSTPSNFDMGFGAPSLTYMGEYRKMEALEPPGLASALIPPNRNEYKLLSRAMNHSIRPPPPPPKPLMMVPHKPLVPHPGSVQQPTARHSIHMCQVCQTDQLTMEGLERHINYYHSRQYVGPTHGYQQPYYQQGPPNQAQWYPGPQNNGMDMERMFRTMGESFAEIMARNDERNKEEQRRQHEDRLREQRAMALVHFNKEIEFRCKAFNPNAHKEEGKKIAAYGKFRNSIRDLTERMDSLKMTESMKYEILTRLVEGDALDTIYKDNPTESTFKESLVKLDKQYLSKSVGVRDLYHQLRNLPKLHEKESRQVNKTVQTAHNVIEQLMAAPVEAKEVWFLLISEALVPKMNKMAYEMWEKIVDKKKDETRPWGHTLEVEDLLNTLQKVKTLMYNREITAGYNRDPPKDDKKQQQSQQSNKKKKEEEDGRKNALYGQLTNAEGADKSGMPLNKAKPEQCPVPQCEASNRAIKNSKGKYEDTDIAHRFLLHCPKIHAMSITERQNFYKKNGCTCTRCFSIIHKYETCPLQLAFPKVCSQKKEDGTVCGGQHHYLLHREKKQNNHNQNTDASEQPQQ